MDGAGTGQDPDRSRPVAGTAGDLLPGHLVDFIKVKIDREFFAARRAAKYYRFSADAKLDFFTADLALHENLKSGTKDFTTEATEKN